jgi:acetylornithine/succinyldiaminopimelate/putrescine aminotransferase
MVGLGLTGQVNEIVVAAREHGLLVVPAGHNTIRLLPALIATPEQLAESVRILESIFSNI